MRKISGNNLKNLAGFTLIEVLIIIIVLAASLVLLLSSPSFAGSDFSSDTEQVLTIDPDSQFGFAENYFTKGDYFRAIGEYERFIYFFPEDARVEQAIFNIGMAFFNDRIYIRAIDTFNQLIGRYKNSDLSVQSYVMISKCYLKLNRTNAAIANLHQLITISDKTDIKDAAYYRIGWIYLETASWEKARSSFEKIGSTHQEAYRLDRLFRELEKKDTIEKKDPGLTGLMSIIPGGGYCYLGRYRDALTAFVVNCSLMYAAYASFDNDNPALGCIVAVVGTGFYAGNILGAVSGARKYNGMQTRRFIEDLKTDLKIDLSADLKKQSVLVSLRYVF